MSGRVMHAGLQLLDRQMIDRNGNRCGKVDDLELSEPNEAGHLHVTAILAGPGVLMQRVGRRRLGGWLRSVAQQVVPSDRPDPVRVPIARVADVGNHVTLSLDEDEVATFGGERWSRDHVIRHIPGSGHRADG